MLSVPFDIELLGSYINSELNKMNVDIENITHFSVGLQRVAQWGARQILLLMRNHYLFLDDAKVYTLKEICSALHVLPRYEVYIANVLHLLMRLDVVVKVEGRQYGTTAISHMDASELDIERQGILSDVPGIETSIEFVACIITDLLSIVTGKKTFVATVFEHGDFDLIQRLYENNMDASYYNLLLSKTVMYTANHAAGHAGCFNILELGAGIGSVAHTLLPMLEASSIDVAYDYTDISGAFLHFGAKRFSHQFKFLRFKKMDINIQPSVQGFKSGLYDVIIAANVVHNALDIENVLGYIYSLLKPDGLLILNEPVLPHDYFSITYDLGTVSRAYKDASQRIPGTPFLYFNVWQRMLSHAGYQYAYSLNTLMKITSTMSQDVIVAVK